jgi:hypothetical protein
MTDIALLEPVSRWCPACRHSVCCAAISMREQFEGTPDAQRTRHMQGRSSADIHRAMPCHRPWCAQLTTGPHPPLSGRCRPTTSFLVPLDRCVALARQGLQPGSLPGSLLLGASGLDKYYRGQVRAGDS